MLWNLLISLYTQSRPMQPQARNEKLEGRLQILPLDLLAPSTSTDLLSDIRLMNTWELLESSNARKGVRRTMNCRILGPTAKAFLRPWASLIEPRFRRLERNRIPIQLGGGGGGGMVLEHTSTTMETLKV